jgi:hypothetical protein
MKFIPTITHTTLQGQANLFVFYQDALQQTLLILFNAQVVRMVSSLLKEKDLAQITALWFLPECIIVELQTAPAQQAI